MTRPVPSTNDKQIITNKNVYMPTVSRQTKFVLELVGPTKSKNMLINRREIALSITVFPFCGYDLASRP